MIATVRITPKIARHITTNEMKFCVSALRFIPSLLKSERMKSYHILKKLSIVYPLNSLMIPMMATPIRMK